MEWHPTKNRQLTPEDITYGSGKKVWWLCPNNHEYEATILHRAHGTECPKCNDGRQTSFAEQAAYFSTMGHTLYDFLKIEAQTYLNS